ncbi:NTP transferase domain-containing protein [Streptomyces sp. NPDC000349]|uniref:NTP transferase domain-containing protein n=1 Tax=unclassified Streptomyces TaxID=2593676 RepID=UPI00277DA8C5|nr:NTP transferase domain-containing protein [Streptomyces sp. DSM 40167]MDQ0405052.1 molybdopterin-guanine dinucleotide biosynthesis protein A [Streptomyces sp. DSM 40167]
MTAYEPSGDPGAGTGPAPGPGPAGYDAVVLAGGAARRLGGADKPGLRVGGRALLDRVLAACAGARTTVVVAGPRPTARPVTWAREDPPGGGPLAALAAGLRHTTAEFVVVLSADLPFLGEPTVARLLSALAAGEADGVLLTDAHGRDQPLVAAYRASAVRRELAAMAGDRAGRKAREEPADRRGMADREDRSGREDPVGDEGRAGRADPAGREGREDPGDRPDLTGMPLRRLTGALRLARVPDAVASFDCDTWDDIATARARIREHGHVLDEWISAAKDELGIDLDVDTGLLLDLARDAAHGVARPAAPLTTFLVGYVAGRAGGGPEAVAEAARKAAALAQRWADEATDARPDA